MGFSLANFIWLGANHYIILGSSLPLSYPIICAHLLFCVSSGIYYAFFWTAPSFLVAVLLKHFHAKCRNTYEEFIQNCQNCLKLYEELSKSLEYYFFLSYFLSQLWLIFIIFFSMSSFLKKKDISNAELILAGGQVITIGSAIFCMITQTEVIDQAFQDVQYLRRQAQEKLLNCSEKSERNQLKFLLRRMEMMEPMNGCGYFGIDKTTLTSMLSVR